jgi:hypothetical protein
MVAKATVFKALLLIVAQLCHDKRAWLLTGASIALEWLVGYGYSFSADASAAVAIKIVVYPKYCLKLYEC